MTITKLAELTGLSENTIRAIEQDTVRRKTHYTTAFLLEGALDMEGMLFHPSELSKIGRPATTGRPLEGKQTACASFETLCPNCCLIVPNMPLCDYCDYNIAERRLFEEIVADMFV